MSNRQPDFARTSHASSYPYISPLKLDMSGRSVLITGAARPNGVGYATATAFARAGASVIVVADIIDCAPHDLEALRVAAKEAGRAVPNIIGEKVNISDLDSVRGMYERLKVALEPKRGDGDAEDAGQTGGSRLDVLVNNAAHQEPYQTILEADPDVYWKTWEVNVRGLFNMTRVFLPLLLSTRNDISSHLQLHSSTTSPLQGLCTMINFSSSGALSPSGGSASYRTSKLAVLRWTENLSIDHTSQGLLAYCVNPGAIKTDITAVVPDHIRDRLPHTPDIAGDTIAYLASERREWLAGRYVSCPWDMQELEERREEIEQGDKLKMRLVI